MTAWQRWLPFQLAVLTFVVVLQLGSGMGMQTLDMWRAQGTPTSFPLTFSTENNNLADIMGTFRYLHQEVLPEHLQNQQRTARKYEIGAILRYRMRWKPTVDLLSSDLQTLPGFGQYMAFDEGLVSSSDSLKLIVQLGDIVGVNLGEFPAVNCVAYDTRWYWYSVSGYCPNLPWNCIRGDETARTCRSKSETQPQWCDHGCDQKQALDQAGTCNASGHDPLRPFTDPDESGAAPRECCLNYLDGSGPVKGGHCPPGQEPTGENGCVYQYDDLTERDMVVLDELTGITGMSCLQDGEERLCRDWNDFRKHCKDKKEFGKQFSLEGEIVETSFCTEYDIHPYCMRPMGCADPACQQLPQDTVELGIPFWRGKCNITANRMRVEAVAQKVLGSQPDKHLVADTTLNNPPCNEDNRICIPTFSGEPYCTRIWAGLCSVCRIPGVQNAVVNSSLPYCPYDINKEKGMDLVDGTQCQTTLPSDLCCLYEVAGGCVEPTTARRLRGDSDNITLDDFLIAHARSARAKSSGPMVELMKRAVAATGVRTECDSSMREFVYFHWAYQPPTDPRAAFNAFLNASLSHGDWLPCPVAPDAAATAVAWVFIILGILVAVAALFFGVRFYMRRASTGRSAVVRSQDLSQQLARTG